MNKFKIILKNLYISKNFLKKLDHNFHELTVLEMIIYFIAIRPIWSKEKRFFFEGCLKVPGQMYIGDRKALYDTILKYKPRHCFEIGTYTGGGSTYFLTSAFKKIGRGKLITMESNKELFARTNNYYSKHLSELLPFIKTIEGGDFNLFLPFMEQNDTVDCFFLDGAENADETKQQYLFFSKYFKPGTILMMHDWNTEKTAEVKPLIINDRNWEIILEINPPESVGFVVLKRK